MKERIPIRKKAEILEEEEELKLYEKLCNFAEKIVKVEPDKNTKQKMERSIEITHLRVSPTGVASLTFLASIALLFLGVLLIILALNLNFSLTYGFLLIIFSLPIGYYLYNYPIFYEKKFMISRGSEITFLILYMIIYMRESPNLEGAVKFAAANLSGNLGKDMKRLIWEIEAGKYTTVDEALIDYLSIWKEEKYFIEAIQMLRESLNYNEEKRLRMLDEAIQIVLQGSEEKTRIYSNELKMPVLLIHALGVLLPVIGLVMFPIIAIFMNIKSEVLFIGYNILLPAILLFLITEVSQRRPATISRITLAEHPRLPPRNHFSIKVGRKYLSFNSIIFSSLFSFPIIIFGLYAFITSNGDKLVESFIITLGIIFFFASYFFLSSFQKVVFREKIRKIEEEFTEALFQLGNKVSTGTPIEGAIERSIKAIGELEIKKFFEVILKNIKNLGMTLHEAIFNREYGAAYLYPSTLIRSIMRIVADASRKGVQVASITMLTISKYLRSVHLAEEKIKDMLSDVLSSLKFQGFFLTPLVCGVVVSLATIIISILKEIMKTQSSIEAAKSYAAGLPFLFGKIGITPGGFQLICSLYFIEATILVAMFTNSIENGEDEIGMQTLAFRMLSIGSVVYFITIIACMLIFGPMATIKV
ncbi:MAG: hypothetical protein QXJ96_00985 [Candidatus Aenigmatarchaeota archaeon]|nr:hypothetical protein [Candidatus Aenigmarchaeota archaeon]